MRERLAVVWLPIALLLIVLAAWTGSQPAGEPPASTASREDAKAPDPADEAKVPDTPDNQAGITAQPEPTSTPDYTSTERSETAANNTLSQEDVAAGMKGAADTVGSLWKRAGEAAGITGTTDDSTTRSSTQGTYPDETGVTREGYDNTTTTPDDTTTRSAWDTQPGTSETGATSTDPYTTDSTTPDATEGLGTYTDSSTTRATRELAYAFHLFDGFERGNAWAVESAADHTVLALSTENASEGTRCLKATFEACGKGNFEMRREVHLDLSQATTMLLDVYNATGAMDLVIGFRAGFDTTLFTSPPKALAPGWNRAVSFTLSEMRSTGGGAFGDSWSYSRDRVSRVSLIFQERDQKKGSVFIDQLRFDRPAADLGLRTKAELKKIVASADAVERYDTLELSVDFEAEYQKLFSRSEVDIIASFLAPSGKRMDVHGFVYDTDATTAKPTWKVRFAPTEVGVWRYDVTIKTEGGEVTSATYTFLCHRKADRKGYIGRSKHDGRYFEFDDGSFYFPIGQNVCWSSKYDYYLKKMQAYGGNCVRVWLCPWNLQLEPTPERPAQSTTPAPDTTRQPDAYGTGEGMGFDVPQENGLDQPGVGAALEDARSAATYDLRTAKALDELLTLCQRRGIYVQLVFRHHGMHGPEWDKNPYNSANGGPCYSPGEFFTSAEAKSLHKQFLDYVVARWGHSTAVFAWELWNEADLAKADRDSNLVAWHKDMAGYLKKIDIRRHLVTTSVATPGKCTALFEQHNIDFVPVHFYSSDILGKVHDSYTRYRKLRKPILIGEFSCGTKPGDDLDDEKGVRIHAGLWAAFMVPHAGGAMPWWWDTYIDKNNLYGHWAALAKFAKGVDRRGKRFEVVRSKVQLTDDLWASIQGLVSPAEAYLWVYDDARIARPYTAERPLLIADRPVRLDGMVGGTFRVEIWDTYEGKILKTTTARAADGVLAFTLPKCNRDIAVKIVRAGGAQPRLEW